MARHWKLLLALLAAMLAIVLLAWQLASDPVSVSVARADRGRVEATVTNSKAGTVRARRRAQISSETGARVIEILHREGDRVKAGDVLVRLNDECQSAELTIAERSQSAASAAARQACLARDLAKREFERESRLAKEGVASLRTLDQLESAFLTTGAACDAARAEEARAEAMVALARVELEKLTIRAPFDGVIADLDVEVGEWITPESLLVPTPAVIDLIDPDSLYVSAPMDEVDSAAIGVGQRAKVTVDSQPDTQFHGKVVRVAPYVLDLEAQNRTVEIEVELDDAALASTLLPGTSADAEVILEVRDPVVRIPASALLEGREVLLVRDGRLVAQPVEIGLKNWDWVEIRRGLEPGQEIVASMDRAEVRAGIRVEPIQVGAQP